MSIRYLGLDPVINVETEQEIFEALDILRTQVADNFGGYRYSPQLMEILEAAMDSVEGSIPRWSRSARKPPRG